MIKVDNPNKYDYAIIVLIVCLLAGNYGGVFRLIRIVSIILLPLYLECSSIQIKGLVFIKKILFCFFIFATFSLIWTPALCFDGIKELLYYIVHFLIFYEIVYFSKRAHQPLESLSWGWTILITLTLCIAYWEILTGNHLPIAREGDDAMHGEGITLTRFVASVTYVNFNRYVTLLCFAFPWICYRFFTGTSIVKRFAYMVVLLLAFFTMVCNSSRGGLLAVAVMFLVYLSKQGVSLKNVLLLVLFTFATSYVVNIIDADYFSVFLLRFSGGVDFSEEGRTEILIACLQSLYETIGFGVGISGMIPAITAINSSITPLAHNLFMEIALQYGVLFFVIFLCFLIAAFRRYSKISNKSRKMVMGMALYAMPFYFIIDSSYLLSPQLYVLFSTIFVFCRDDEFSDSINKLQHH